MAFKLPADDLYELSRSGNSGNPSTTAKPSNSTAVKVRGSKPGTKKIKRDSVQQTTVSPSAVDIAQPPSTTTEGNSYDPMQDFSLDRYRLNRNLGEPEEDMPAALKVVSFKGEEIFKAYSNFFLQSVSESEQEKYQIVETFTAYYAFFFGKRPPIYTFSGVLLNDPDNNWMGTFRFLYENYFRGTAAAELGSQATLTYDKRVVSGYLLNLSISQDAMQDKGVPFSFSMLVITHDLVGFSSDFDAFIQKQQEELRRLKEKATADIAGLNKNPDTMQKIIANQALGGKNSFARLGKPDKNVVVSQKAEGPSVKNTLAQNAVNNMLTSGNDLASTQK